MCLCVCTFSIIIFPISSSFFFLPSFSFVFSLFSFRFLSFSIIINKKLLFIWEEEKRKKKIFYSFHKLEKKTFHLYMNFLLWNYDVNFSIKSVKSKNFPDKWKKCLFFNFENHTKKHTTKKREKRKRKEEWTDKRVNIRKRRIQLKRC